MMTVAEQGSAEQQLADVSPWLNGFSGLAVNVVGSAHSEKTGIVLETVRLLAPRCRPSIVLNGTYNSTRARELFQAGATVQHPALPSRPVAGDILFLETDRPITLSSYAHPKKRRLVVVLTMADLGRASPSYSSWLTDAHALLLTGFDPTVAGQREIDELKSQLEGQNPYIPVFAVMREQPASIAHWASWIMAQWRRTCNEHT